METTVVTTAAPLGAGHLPPPQDDVYGVLRFGLCLIDALIGQSDRLHAIAVMLGMLRDGLAPADPAHHESHQRVRALLMEFRQRDSGPDEQPEARPSHQRELFRNVSQPLRMSHLTPRQLVVLRLIGSGFSSKQIARDLRITPETVKTHTKNIFDKLGARTRADAITRAVKLNLL